MKKILVIDDDPDIIELTRNRLEANNYTVISATDGKAGIEKAQQHSPDMIIIDIMMPRMQGGEAVRYLRSNPLTRNIPVIFLTAISAQHPQGEESQGINVDGELFTAIPKPFKSEKLISTIRKMMKN